MKATYSLILLLLIIYYIQSEKIIEVYDYNSVYCEDNKQDESNLYFRFILNATFINISDFKNMKYFLLPLEGPYNMKAMCTPQMLFSRISCSLNVGINPIINQTVIIDTSFDKIDDIKIIWNIKNPEIYEGTCTIKYDYKFSVDYHDENTICEDGYNVFNINGTTETVVDNFDMKDSPVFQISFLIGIDENESGSAICYWHSWEDYMQCKVKTDKAKAKGIFYRTIFDIRNYYKRVLIEQSFEIEFQDCRPETYINITNVTSVICYNHFIDIYLFTKFDESSHYSSYYFPLKYPENKEILCYAYSGKNEFFCTFYTDTDPIINDKITFDTSFIKMDNINIIWNLENPTVFDGTCTPKYSQQFTVERYDENIKCQYGYNYFTFYGTYEDYNINNNKYLSFLSETIKVNYQIYLNNKLEYINCYIYDSEGKMECWINAEGNITFFTTTAKNTADKSYILIKQSYQKELKNCKTEEKIIEITKWGDPRCIRYELKSLGMYFFLTANFQNIQNKDDFELPLKCKNDCKTVCSFATSGLGCLFNATTYPIINEKIYLDTSINMINGDTRLIWNLDNPSLLVYNETCVSNYEYKFTVNGYDKETICEDNYTNSINIFGIFEKTTNNNNNLKEYYIRINIYLDDVLENIKCTLYDNEGKMKCFLEGSKKAKFMNTLTKINYGSSLLLIKQEFEINIKNCSLPEPVSSSNYINIGLLSLFSLLILII